jgi:predicted transcriptional regulator
MTNLTIAIPDDRSLKLKEMAARFNLTPEELVSISIEDLLARPEDSFRLAVEHVLKKNAELYRGLA